MLNTTLAKRVRHIMILAIALHLYATCRFVYSWPMDEAYVYNVASIGNDFVDQYAKVNKNPPFNILYIETQPWQSEGQRATMLPYKWLTIVILAICLYIIFGTRIVEILKAAFCIIRGPSGEAVGIPFFSVPKIGCYCPVVERNGEIFICADTSQAMEEFQPSVANAINVSFLVPEVHRMHALSTVKWYGLGKTKRANDVLINKRQTDNQSPQPTAPNFPIEKHVVDSNAAAAKYLSRETRVHPSHEIIMSSEQATVSSIVAKPLIKPKMTPSYSFSSLPDSPDELHAYDARNDIHNISANTFNASITKKHGKRRIRKRSGSAIELAPLRVRGFSPLN